jgi:hypothetical protein
LLTKFKIILLSNLSVLSVPDEGYSRNAPCALNWISTFFLTVLGDATIHDVLMAYNKLAHPRISVTSTVIVQHGLTLNRIVEFVSKHR